MGSFRWSVFVSQVPEGTSNLEMVWNIFSTVGFPKDLSGMNLDHKLMWEQMSQNILLMNTTSLEKVLFLFYHFIKGLLSRILVCLIVCFGIYSDSPTCMGCMKIFKPELYVSIDFQMASGMLVASVLLYYSGFWGSCLHYTAYTDHIMECDRTVITFHGLV